MLLVVVCRCLTVWAKVCRRVRGNGLWLCSVWQTTAIAWVTLWHRDRRETEENSMGRVPYWATILLLTAIAWPPSFPMMWANPDATWPFTSESQILRLQV